MLYVGIRWDYECYIIVCWWLARPSPSLPVARLQPVQPVCFQPSIYIQVVGLARRPTLTSLNFHLFHATRYEERWKNILWTFQYVSELENRWWTWSNDFLEKILFSYKLCVINRNHWFLSAYKTIKNTWTTYAYLHIYFITCRILNRLFVCISSLQ